jgi:hypothetical protein
LTVTFDGQFFVTEESTAASENRRQRSIVWITGMASVRFLTGFQSVGEGIFPVEYPNRNWSLLLEAKGTLEMSNTRKTHAHHHIKHDQLEI